MKADVIVVGAGSAGATLAARLSEDPARSVILLEAGGSDRNPLFRVPLMTGVLLRSNYANWSYKAEPSSGLDGRAVDWPRGRVLGGSSSINGMHWHRGRPSDYDRWAQSGLRGWNWDQVLVAYKSIERFEDGETDVHGGAGPMPVTLSRAENPLYEAFLEAGAQAGHPASRDFNAPPFEGVGRYHFSIADGQRWSASRAFLDPVRGRPNLKVVTGAHVGRVAIEKGRATGVVAKVGGEATTIAGGEVVLAGGVVNSPQLLMLSGVGPADHLREHGIAVVRDLPGVGQNLQDHIALRVQHRSLEPVTLYSLARLDRATLALLQALVLRKGPASSMAMGAGFLLRAQPGGEEPDVQGLFMPCLTQTTVRAPFFRTPADGDGHAFTCSFYALRPESRGEIALRSADPFAAPAIRPNYLSDPRDLDTTRRGVEIVREIFAQPAFARYRGPEIAPGPEVDTTHDLEAWIRRAGISAYHPVGTCKMGHRRDRTAVVDDRLRVLGVDNLRVADASVMPTVISGNTNAPSIMIGHRCADFIAGREG